MMECIAGHMTCHEEEETTTTQHDIQSHGEHIYCIPHVCLSLSHNSPRSSMMNRFIRLIPRGSRGSKKSNASMHELCRDERERVCVYVGMDGLLIYHTPLPLLCMRIIRCLSSLRVGACRIIDGQTYTTV